MDSDEYKKKIALKGCLEEQRKRNLKIKEDLDCLVNTFTTALRKYQRLMEFLSTSEEFLLKYGDFFGTKEISILEKFQKKRETLEKSSTKISLDIAAIDEELKGEELCHVISDEDLARFSPKKKRLNIVPQIVEKQNEEYICLDRDKIESKTIMKKIFSSDSNRWKFKKKTSFSSPNRKKTDRNR